jgi:hypothetical protein
MMHSKELGACQWDGSPPRQDLKGFEDCSKGKGRDKKDGKFGVPVGEDGSFEREALS